MGYGFVIDQRKCIGCHACTVACKAENEVPLGDFRTWVKYTEKGAYPDVRRHFTVLRCNHCDEAPCVEICPVSALEKRPDAIVDLNRDQCIGCAGCMQACPYDAIYINEQRGTAEKCHYCAHRTEIGLEPACVVVCPEQAIVAGDADNPATEIGSLIANEQTSQRKLEKGTRPRVWYVDALEESLVPGSAAEPTAWLWSDRRVPPPELPEDFQVPEYLTTTLNVQHKPRWGWHVWSYLVTKNIAAGAMILAPLAALLGLAEGAWRDYAPEVVGLFFWAVTNYLLVADLGRPERFLKILFQPNTRSWLVKGAWVLTAYSILAGGSLLARFLGMDALADNLRWINLPVAIMTAGYSAFLFGQCKGRDLWLENGLFLQLTVRAALMGAMIGMVLPQAAERNTPGIAFCWLAIAAAVGIFWERQRLVRGKALAMSEAILRESFRSQAGMVLLIVSAVIAQVGLNFVEPGLVLNLILVLAGGHAVVGLFLYERAWIRAGQAVPNS